MPEFQPRFAGFEARIRDSFARQHFMGLLGAELSDVGPGFVEIEVPFREALTQQHGFLHGGVTASIMDTACGFSAVALMEEGTGILTIEFKTNFLATGEGDRFRFCADVIKPGRTITVSEAKAFAVKDGFETLFATMTATMMTVKHREAIRD